MGGAFVGVADDASAVYWNPGGLAPGAFFSLVLDSARADGEHGGPGSRAGERSGWLLALSTPALGLSYYRLQSRTAAPLGLNLPDLEPVGLTPASVRIDSLVTHHVGATVVQSLRDGVSVGATVKMVRGLAGSAEVAAASPRRALDDWDVAGRGSTRPDLDVGIMAAGAVGRLGLTVRNVTEPAFETGMGRDLRLERQVRAGASILLLQNWTLASDVDLTRSAGPAGDVRELAVGTEGQVTRRLATRAGIRLNTAGDRGRSPSFSAGGSYAVLGALMVDAQVTAGPDEAFRGWGVAARMGF
jgi:hypothetical protein